MKIRGIGLVLLLCVLNGPAQDWLGFHGLERQGVGLSASSPDWSGGLRPAWKTPVAGLGFSSPVVAGDRIYLTTAYQTGRGSRTRLVVESATAGLAFGLFAIAGVWSVGILSRQAPARQMMFSSGCVVLVMGLISLGLGLSLFGEQLFGLESSAHRSWKVGTAAASLSVFIILLLAGRRVEMFFLAGVVSTLLDLCAYVLMPRPELFLRLSSSDGIISTGAVLLPAAAAWGMLLIMRLWGPTPEPATWGPQTTGRALWLRIVLCLGLPLLVATGFFWALVRHAAKDGTTQVLLRPTLPWAAVGALAITCVLVVVAGGVRALRQLRPGGGLRVSAALLSALLGLGSSLQYGWLPGQKQLAFAVACLEKNTGRTHWVREVAYTANLRDMNQINSRATPTLLATPDGLCAYFGNAGLYGLDLDGRLKWKVEDLPFETSYGIGHSPTFAEGAVILANDNETFGSGRRSPSVISAYKASDGRLLWRRERAASERGSAAYNTPIICTLGGLKTVLVRGWEDVTAYDLHSGEVRWTCRLKHRGEHLVASVVTDGKRLYLVDAAVVMAMQLEALGAGRGDAVWSVPLSGEKISTPVIADGFLYAITETGQAVCIDAEKGVVQWKQKLRGRFFASIVACGNGVWFASEAGDLFIAARGPKFALISEGALHEKIYATPVPQAGGALVRTTGNLYWIGHP